MAGFRNGRGQGEAGAQAPRAAHGTNGQPGYPRQQSPAAGAPTGEPEYFGETGPYGSYGPQGAYGPPHPRGPQGRTPRNDGAPGRTRAFTVPDGPAAQGAYGDVSGSPAHPGAAQGYGDDVVATYRAGQAAPPPVPSGPRLPWQELLSGIVLRPGRTFWQMRDYPVWGPALLVTFGYGLLVVFGFDTARADILSSGLSTSLPWVLITAAAVVLSGLTTGSVTHTLARQFGGDGAWAPTVGLAMLITSLTDAPRLLFAIFLGGANGLVQLLGWATWLACGALLTSMVGRSHDLPWHRALGASSVQLLALLVLFKLPVL